MAVAEEGTMAQGEDMSQSSPSGEEQRRRRRQLMEQRIKTILAQRRTVLNFKHYTPSPVHYERMKELAQLMPHLYDNPEITPRSKWFSHVNYGRNSQMPPYHVHFREESQQVISFLYQAHQQLQLQQEQEHESESSSPTKKLVLSLLKRASSMFQGSMRGLKGHVSIEEYMCFPKYASTFPNVDIRFLYDDHEELHKAEHDVQVQLIELVEAFSHSSSPLPSRSITGSSGDDDDGSSLQLLLTTTLQAVLEFDDLLLAHLGEEEEIVVPMSLTEKRIVF
jgi:hypothetical protein